ncbi:MAG: thioredoxin [Candidatus Moranbacteria bacterium]|nr:thioredoxin [Candidatus Moranbacteria bacterium]
MAAIQLTDKNFKKEVLECDVPILVDFFAPWCGPCQMMEPIVKGVSEEVTGAKVGALNVDENPDTAAEYDVMSLPTLKIFKSGKVVKEFMGIQTKDRLKDELMSV